MLRWYPSILLQVVLELTFVPIAGCSIFAVNAIADHDTPWIIGALTGPGPSADFWPILLLLGLGWLVLTLGWRGAKTAFKWMLAVWHVGLTTTSLVLVFSSGELVMYGDAIGFNISLEVLGPVFAASTLTCALVWIAGDVRRGERKRSVSPLQRRNKLAAGGVVAGLSLSAFAFWLDFEQFGTIAGILATFAGHEAMRPVNPSAELQKALFSEGSAPH